MGLSLGSIVSDIKSLATDPGKVAKDICDAVLPGNMKAIGDIVGGAVDYETGHPLQALGHLTDALKDLPQLAQSMSGSSTTGAKPALAPPGTLAAEPTPPPTRAPVAPHAPPVVTASTGSALGSATSALQTALSGLTTTPGSSSASAGSTAGTPAGATPATPAGAPNVTVSTGAAPGAGGRSGQQVSFSVNVGGTSVTVTESMAQTETLVGRRDPRTGATTWREEAVRRPTFTVTTAAAAGTQAAGTPTSSSVPTGASTSPPPGAASAAASGTTSASGTSGTAATGSSSTTANASATAASGASGAGTAAGTSATTGASSTGTPSGASSTGTPSSLAALMAMSPDQFMQAVTSGNIPPDVANNPAAMTQIQARMNQITQMNQLVTSMMAAMHQMQMSIIQNIRV